MAEEVDRPEEQPGEPAEEQRPGRRWLPHLVGWLGAAIFIGAGLWAMIAPESFFESAARFEPYNQHFVQDIGAFQIGLGAVLLLALLARRADALAVALLGVGIGSAAHVVSHIAGIGLGGQPVTDIPTFVVLTGFLLVAGVMRWRATRR